MSLTQNEIEMIAVNNDTLLIKISLFLHLFLNKFLLHEMDIIANKTFSKSNIEISDSFAKIYLNKRTIIALSESLFSSNCLCKTVSSLSSEIIFNK